jgi:hypothetical protein
MTDNTLDLLREQLRELELDAVLIKGRIEQLRDTIGLLEHGPRRRPARQVKVVPIVPERVPGGTHEPEAA